MRVLLVNSNIKDDLLAAPPLGLCYVATAAEAAGHDVSMVDLCFAGLGGKRKLTRAIRSFQPDVIGISVRNIDNVNMLRPVWYLPPIAKLTAQIRKITSAPVVIGGSAASLMPEEVLRLLGADYIVVSDGEESFVRLLAAIERGEQPERLPGVGMLVDGKLRLTAPELNKPWNGFPDLGRWVDLRPYRKIGSSYNVQSKRGCRLRCIYCTYNQSLEGSRLRLRSAEDVVDEVEEALFRYRPKIFEFVDSTFNDPVDHSVAILEEIIRRPWNAEFTTMGVVPRNLDDEYLDLMWRAGFRSFMITPDSASETMIRNYRKSFTFEDVVRATEAINRRPFAAWWYFMIGGPGETNETLQESLDFALEHLPRRGRSVTNIAHFFLGVRVYPRTKLWDIAQREGFVPAQADPLRPTWYLSEGLDIDRAIDQMTQAALKCPEIYLGFDEGLLIFSKPARFVFNLLKLPGPYWRYFRAGNAFGLKTGIRWIVRPIDVPGSVRGGLERQGYEGVHLSGRQTHREVTSP